MSFDVFAELSEIESKIESGEITGFIKFKKLEGEAQLLKVEEVQNAQGKTFFEFTLKSQEGQTSFGCRVPSKTEKNAAIFMAMQSLKACLCIPGLTEKEGIQKAYEILKKCCSIAPIPVLYKLREYESMSAKDGKIYTNQSLESLDTNKSEIQAYIKMLQSKKAPPPPSSDDIPF